MNKLENDICQNIWIEYEPQLRKVATAKLYSHPDEIDDVISDVFVALCEKVQKDGVPEKLKGWIYGTLNNIINLKFRELYRIKEKESCLLNIEVEIPVTNDVIEEKIDEIYNDEIKNRLKELLNENEYEIIYLLHFKKLKMKEVARLLNSTETAIKQKHYRICKKLRKIIDNSKNLI